MADQAIHTRPDFFISYTAADRAWAEWIAHTLEDNGHHCVVQAWDFRPGANFVVEMHKAASQAERTIVVLSPAYLWKPFPTSEWATAFADDPEGLGHKLVPVRVEECRPEGLLKAIVRIDLVGLDEAAAAAALLDGVAPGRVKPAALPSFPGAGAKAMAAQALPFPGKRTRREPLVFGNADAGTERELLAKPTTVAASEWSIANPEPIVGLAELALHIPRTGNEADTYHIVATLKLGQGDFDHDGRPILISIRDALLSVSSPSHPVVQGSLIGERAPHDHFDTIPGGLRVKGPRNKRGQLAGDVLGGEYILAVTSNGEGEKPVIVTLAAFRRSFDVVPADKRGKPVASCLNTEARDAVVNALIFRLLKKDGQGRGILQQARMQRKSKP